VYALARAGFVARSEDHTMVPDLYSRASGLQRLLCIVVLILIAVAVLYAAWIGISNYSRIRV
jgi:hypothetical protein